MNDNTAESFHELIAARQGLVTGEIQFRRMKKQGVNVREDRLLSKFAGPQRIISNNGSDLASDEPPKPLLGADGKPVLDAEGGHYFPAPVPNLLLNEPGVVWKRASDMPYADHYQGSIDFAEMQLPDPRCFGVGAVSQAGSLEYCLLGEFSEDKLAPIAIEEEQDGDMRKLTLNYPIGSRTLWLDPARGWCPVRAIAKSKDGEIEYETVSELTKFDDYWFPSEVTTYRGSRQGGDIIETVTVEHAEFNRDTHPLVLTPEDIGIRIGMQVNSHDDKLQNGDALVYNNGLVTREAFRQLRSEGKIQPGNEAAPARTANSAVQPSDPLYAFISAWRDYTNQFCTRYALSSEQKQTALRILENAEAAADRLMQSRADRIRELQKALPDAAEESAAAKRRDELLKVLQPLDKIFQRQLKSRLERIPTRNQRKDAASRSELVEPKVEELLKHRQ
ncbi:MAG: hypothetical protein AB7N71_00670 [Phycisphaerae bacterium]